MSGAHPNRPQRRARKPTREPAPPRHGSTSNPSKHRRRRKKHTNNPQATNTNFRGWVFGGSLLAFRARPPTDHYGAPDRQKRPPNIPPPSPLLTCCRKAEGAGGWGESPRSGEGRRPGHPPSGVRPKPRQRSHTQPKHISLWRREQSHLPAPNNGASAAGKIPREPEEGSLWGCGGCTPARGCRGLNALGKPSAPLCVVACD